MAHAHAHAHRIRARRDTAGADSTLHARRPTGRSALVAGQLVVVDVRAGRVIANLDGFPAVTGVLAVPVEHRAYASATGDHAVVVVDDSTFRIVARVPGPRFPDGIAYAPEERRVFVSDESERRDFVIVAATNSVVARIELDGEAGNTQYDPGSHCVIVAVQTANQLAVIDPATATWCACGRSWSRSSDPMSSATGRRPASYSRRSGRVRRRC